MNSKRKGNAGERELLEILTRHGNARRNDQTFVSGLHNPDISFHAFGKSFHVECKRGERLNLTQAAIQAEGDAAPGTIPIVMHRRNRRPWYVTLRLSDFFEVLEGKREEEQP